MPFRYLCKLITKDVISGFVTKLQELVYKSESYVSLLYVIDDILYRGVIGSDVWDFNQFSKKFADANYIQICKGVFFVEQKNIHDNSLDLHPSLIYIARTYCYLKKRQLSHEDKELDLALPILLSELQNNIPQYDDDPSNAGNEATPLKPFWHGGERFERALVALRCLTDCTSLYCY